MKKKLRNSLFVSLSILFGSPVQAETVLVSQFEKEELSGWEEESFAGETQYRLVDLNGEKVLKATSHAAASGLFKKVHIDLERTPYLNWSWRVEGLLSGLDERQKSGDDYPARIYVIVDGGLFFWKTKALNYVWSSNQPKESRWPNAYSSNAQMIAVESGGEKLGRWVSEKRNIRDDLKNWFGETFRYIDAVAVMTDTDNSKGAAVAYYRGLFFSSD
ncbi:MAG: hypothetical protein DRQ61_06865 [Gammaproteobacteria bacterium]|nr:MAG: hypothetical protein DRQ61_06865 [Gammaproteobacteria bacterium]